MSGHSKWATTHRQKSAADAKKGAAFTKIANLLTVAAREGGGDLDSNFKLRLAFDKARAVNMPKDNIQRAIDKGAGSSKDGVNFEEAIYEVVGPAGSGFIVEAITDNKNRTVADLKAILNKNSGQLGSANSIAWMFERKGQIIINSAELNEEKELEIIDAGADDITQGELEWVVVTAADKLNAVSTALKEKNIEIKEAGLIYSAKDQVEIANQEDQEKIERLYNLIEDMDDVSNVYTNANW
jgi:YebC/PmpR family DNA-binding regulatory protein